MAQPYDYSLNLPSPFTAFTQGMQVGQVSRATELERQKAQAEADRAQRLNAAIAQLGPNATYADYMAAINANPDFADTLLSRWNTMSEANQNALFDAGALAWQSLTPDLEGNLDPTRAIDVLEERATAFENSGQTDMAQQLRDSARAMQVNPAAANSTLGLMLAATNPDRFKTLSDAAENRTPFRRDYEFIRDIFGDQAAAEFAQFGRDSGVVTIPYPDGRTYVGPASMAPGAAPWQQRGASGRSQPQPQNGAPTRKGIPTIMGQAVLNQSITQEEANVILQSLGPNGQARFNSWLADNNVRIIRRKGTASDGRRVVEYTDGTIEYAAN